MFSIITYEAEEKGVDKYNAFISEGIENIVNNALDYENYPYPVNTAIENFRFHKMRTAEVKNTMKKVKSGNSTDCTNSKVIEMSGEFLHKTLIEIFNKSLNAAFFPIKWKQSTISSLS